MIPCLWIEAWEIFVSFVSIDKADAICLFLVFRCFDSDADNYISYDEHVKGMSVFLKGKFEEKLKCKTARFIS